MKYNTENVIISSHICNKSCCPYSNKIHFFKTDSTIWQMNRIFTSYIFSCKTEGLGDTHTIQFIFLLYHNHRVRSNILGIEILLKY